MSVEELRDELVNLISSCNKAVNNPWDELVFVFDIGTGVVSNSGFLYHNEKSRPASARISDEPLTIMNKVLELKAAIESLQKRAVKQVVIQLSSAGDSKMEVYDEIKLRFTPPKLASLREQLKPNFHTLMDASE